MSLTARLFSNFHCFLSLLLFRVTNRLILPSSSSSTNIDTVDSNEKTLSNAINQENDTILDILMKRSDGVDIAHEHAKYLSKYMFSLIHYVQERSIEELEHAERTSKLAANSSLSSFLATYRYLPGVDLMMRTLKKDSTYHSRIQSTWLVLQTHEFIGVNINWIRRENLILLSLF